MASYIAGCLHQAVWAAISHWTLLGLENIGHSVRADGCGKVFITETVQGRSASGSRIGCYEYGGAGNWHH